MKLFEDEPAKAPRTGAGWEQHRKHRQPHSGPAQDEIGTLAASAFVLARSSDVTVAVSGITAYSDGVLLHVVVLFADEQKRELLDWSLQEYGRSPGRFRLGAVLPSGARATTGTGDAPPLESPKDQAVLLLQRSSAGPLRWDGDYWLWPLPEAGQLVLGCRWPDRGIDETLVSLETEPLRTAAAATRSVWQA